MIINKFKIILACILIFNLSFVFSQSNNEPDNDKRLITSMTQLTAALSIQHGISNDIACKGKKYSPLPVNDYVDFIASKDEKDSKKSKSKSEKDEMVRMLGGLIYANIPGKGLMWQETYNAMIKNTKNVSPISGEALCDSLNGNAVSLFQKAMDNLRLMK
jgi:hypothetical protein